MGLAIVEEAGLTDVGRQRKTNEDSFVESSPLFAVADGMGGARAGEVASRIAVEAFEEERDPSASPETQLTRIVQAANRRIHDLAQEDESRAGMGTTLTAVMVGDHDVAVGHVGDSRAYRLRRGGLERLTTDHSLVEEYVRRGELTREAAEVHPQRSIITRALGPEADVEVETFSLPAGDGDVYLICSDGLTGMVSEERMEQVLKDRGSLQEAGQELINLANANGGRDNITVVLFRLGADDERPEEQDTGELSAAAVGAAAAAAGSRRPAGESETFLLDAGTAEQARAESRPAAAAPSPTDESEGQRGAAAATSSARPTRRRRSPLRVAARLLVTVAVLAGLVAGLVLLSRQAFFLGTDDRGLLTLYRGLPYEGPLGARLYSEDYRSAIPVQTIPKMQRERILDHELRSRGDAADLVRRLEIARAAVR